MSYKKLEYKANVYMILLYISPPIVIILSIYNGDYPAILGLFLLLMYWFLDKTFLELSNSEDMENNFSKIKAKIFLSILTIAPYFLYYGYAIDKAFNSDDMMLSFFIVLYVLWIYLYKDVLFDLSIAYKEYHEQFNNFKEEKRKKEVEEQRRNKIYLEEKELEEEERQKNIKRLEEEKKEREERKRKRREAEREEIEEQRRKEKLFREGRNKSNQSDIDDILNSID